MLASPPRGENITCHNTSIARTYWHLQKQCYTQTSLAFHGYVNKLHVKLTCISSSLKAMENPSSGWLLTRLWFLVLIVQIKMYDYSFYVYLFIF